MAEKQYGWRARIGLLTPDINTVTEVDFNRVVPDGVSIHAARMPVQDPVDAASMEKMNEDIGRAAEAVSKTDPDVIAYGVTAGSFLEGKEFDVELEADIEARTGVPAVTTAAAARRALSALGVESLVVATPYLDELSDLLVEFLHDYGFKVQDIHGENFESGGNYGTANPERVYQRVKNLDTDKADGVFISGMEYPGTPVVEQLESDLEIPVVTAHTATLWNALREVDVSRESVPGGQLMRR